MNIKDFLENKNWAVSLCKMHYNKRKLIEHSLMLHTPFLPQSATLQQRGWHILNDVNTVPLCPICNTPVKFQRTNKYSKYCSIKCSKQDLTTMVKKMQTEYDNCGGIDNYKKKKADQLKRDSRRIYGVDNFSQSKEVQSMIKRNREEPN